MPGTDDIAARLQSIAEELADKALDALRAASDTDDADERSRHSADERRVTRARRAVEKAATLLRGADVAGTSDP